MGVYKRAIKFVPWQKVLSSRLCLFLPLNLFTAKIFSIDSIHFAFVCECIGSTGGSWWRKQRKIHYRARTRLHGILHWGRGCHLNEVSVYPWTRICHCCLSRHYFPLVLFQSLQNSVINSSCPLLAPLSFTLLAFRIVVLQYIHFLSINLQRSPYFVCHNRD